MPVGIHYRVAFLDDGETRYGIVEVHTKKAEDFANVNTLVVRDAVYPKTWLVEERFVRDIPITSREYENYIDTEYQRALTLSDSTEGCKKGKMLIFHVNGGHAYYVITKTTKTLVHLEWRGFSLDRWTEPVLGYFGKMMRSRAEILISAEDNYRKSGG